MSNTAATCVNSLVDLCEYFEGNTGRLKVYSQLNGQVTKFFKMMKSVMYMSNSLLVKDNKHIHTSH